MGSRHPAIGSGLANVQVRVCRTRFPPPTTGLFWGGYNERKRLTVNAVYPLTTGFQHRCFYCFSISSANQPGFAFTTSATVASFTGTVLSDVDAIVVCCGHSSLSPRGRFVPFQTFQHRRVCDESLREEHSFYWGCNTRWWVSTWTRFHLDTPLSFANCGL